MNPLNVDYYLRKVSVFLYSKAILKKGGYCVG